MCFLQIKLLVYSQTRTWNLYIRTLISEKAEQNKNTRFPRTSSLLVKHKWLNTVILYTITVTFCLLTKSYWTKLLDPYLCYKKKHNRCTSKEITDNLR